MEKILIVGADITATTKALKEITDRLTYYVAIEGFMRNDFSHLDGHNKPLIATTNKLFDQYMIYRFDKVIFLANTDELTVQIAKSLFNKDIRELSNESIVYDNINKHLIRNKVDLKNFIKQELKITDENAVIFASNFILDEVEYYNLKNQDGTFYLDVKDAKKHLFQIQVDDNLSTEEIEACETIRRTLFSFLFRADLTNLKKHYS
ncbi:hypothetical protein ALC152_05290 [Arcobacter sp. 15-2]|uniref:hypothetical protein n=1 Tax=Arcobacter sp. 15-2 TaxID=3374109 RepID=UPI00399C7349